MSTLHILQQHSAMDSDSQGHATTTMPGFVTLSYPVSLDTVQKTAGGEATKVHIDSHHFEGEMCRTAGSVGEKGKTMLHFIQNETGESGQPKWTARWEMTLQPKQMRAFTFDPPLDVSRVAPPSRFGISGASGPMPASRMIIREPDSNQKRMETSVAGETWKRRSVEFLCDSKDTIVIQELDLSVSRNGELTFKISMIPPIRSESETFVPVIKQGTLITDRGILRDPVGGLHGIEYRTTEKEGAAASEQSIHKWHNASLTIHTRSRVQPSTDDEVAH